MKRLHLACILGFALAFPLVASAQDKAHAKEAYERGVEAHKRGDFQRAAEEFARADAIAPSPVALQAAVDETILADDPALGEELVERSQRAPATGDLAKSIETAKKKFAGRAGRVKVACPEGATCLATLDSTAIAVGKPVWSRSGQHTIVVQVDGESQTKLVDVKADQTTDVTPTPKSAPPPAVAPAATTPPPPPTSPPPYNEGGAVKDHPDALPPRDMKNGLPPIIFWVGAGATVLFAGAGITLGLVTKSKHEEFIDAGCDKANNPGCKDKGDVGLTTQILADVSFGVTALAGVATIVIGVAFTDWNARGPVSSRGAKVGVGGAPQVTPVAGGAVAGYGGRF
jgi:hypothetical protein